MTYQRKCANWMQTFRDWVAPRSEAPESFIFWAGAYTLASALRRRVYIGEKVFGSWQCYPHLYVMFVGPPGMRKTTALDRSVDLLDQVPEHVKRPPTLITKESLVQAVMNSPDAAISATVGEFSDLIMKGGKEMYDLITSLYDAKRELSVGTMMRGREGVEKPCMNLLACTTPAWIAENVPEHSIGGGFASRFIFVYEDEIMNRQLYRRKHMSEENKLLYYNQLELDLVSDLAHIASLNGEFDITEEAEEYGENWYQKFDVKGSHKKIQGYMQRKHLHVHKLAMILTVAMSDELIITQPVLEAAIKIVEATEKKLPLVFGGVGKNVHAVTMRDILDFIKNNSPLERSLLFQNFESNAEPDRLDKLITGLITQKVIKSELDTDKKDYVYTYIGRVG